MKKYATLWILIVLAPLNCAFDWGFGVKDTCGEAKRIVAKLDGIANADERNKAEKRVVQLCPDGAAGHFISALNRERKGDGDGALAEYRAALQADTAFPEAHGNVGLILLRKGMYDEAAVELTLALRGHPDPRYDQGLAKIYVERRFYPLALYHLGEALRAFPADASLHVSVAEAFAGMGLMDKAEGEYTKALAIEPGNRGGRLGLAALLAARNQLDQSIAELKKADTAYPGDKEIHRLLAEVYEKKGDREKANYEYLLAGLPPKEAPAPTPPSQGSPEGSIGGESAEAPESLKEEEEAPRPEELQKQGDAQMAAGRDDEAIASYREAIRLKGENGGLHHNLGLLYEKKGLLDEAVVEYRQSLQFEASNNAARQRLADIYASRGSFPQAVEQYREMLKKDKDNPSLHMKLARAYASAKNLKEAVAEYLETIRLDADVIDAHRELAAIYKKSNLNDDAAKQYREVLRLKKDDVDARNALTSIYVKNKNYDDLIELLRENVELNSQDPNSHYKLGLVFESKKNYEDAIARYQEAIKLKSDHAKALNALGRVYMKTGHINEAKEALEAAKQADPALEETTVLLSNIKDEFYPEQKISKYKKKGKKGKKGKSGKKGTKGKGKKSKKGAKKS